MRTAKTLAYSVLQITRTLQKSFEIGCPALPRADRLTPELALPLSGGSGSVAPGSKGSSLRREVRTSDHHFPTPTPGQLCKSRQRSRWLDAQRRCRPVPNRRWLIPDRIFLEQGTEAKGRNLVSLEPTWRRRSIETWTADLLITSERSGVARSCRGLQIPFV